MAPPAKKAKTIPNRTSGIHCGLRGNEYQIYMTMYMLVRAHNKYPAHQDYELRIERPEPEVGKFDDIWLKVGDEEVFVQAKYDAVSPTLTKGMLQSKGKDDRFSLYKYSESFKECRKLASPQRGKQIWWNVLMTNLPLSGKVSDIFESFDVDCMLTKVLGTGDLMKLKTGKMQKELGASKEFYEDFLLSVGSETSKTNKSCFQKLQRLIQDEIERVMFEDAEHTFHRLRVNVVKWVCNKICRDEKHFNRKWVDDFFKDIQNDYKSIIEAYRLELKDRLELYEHVTIGDRKVDSLKQCMQNEKVILLSIVESSILRLKQVYQILKDEKFTYLLFSRLQNISTREKVQNALKQNDSSKNVLIILHDRKDAKKLFEFTQEIHNMCTTIIIISEMTRDLSDHFNANNISYELDSEEITMADFTTSTRDYLSKSTVAFQGIEQTIEELPNVPGFESNISGARLEALIDGYPVIIGTNLPSVESRCSFYVGRRFSSISSNYFSQSKLREDDEVCFVENVHEIDANNDLLYGLIIKDENELIDIEALIDGSSKLIVFVEYFEDYCYMKKSLNCIKCDKYFNFLRTRRSYLADWCIGGKDEYKFLERTHYYPKQVIILAGDIGTGKSTTFLRLANNHKEAYPSTWVIFADLNTETTKNKEFELEESVTRDFAVKLMCNLVATEQDSEYFEDCVMNDPENVVVYLDGFDETCPIYKDSVLKFIEVLVDLRVKRIFVSTRTQFERELMEHFSTITYNLYPLDEKECVSLLESLWKEEGRSEQQACEMVKEINNKLQHFMQGVPMVFKMLAKIPSKDVDNFMLNSFTLYDFFEVFMKNILERYFVEKSKMNINQNFVRSRDIPRLQESYSRDYNLIAIKLLYTEDHIGKFFSKHDHDEWTKLSRQPIVYVTCSEIIKETRFVHQSYAQFFAAVFIYDKFIQEKDGKQFWDHYRPALVAEGLVSDFFFQKIFSNFNNDTQSKIMQLFELILNVSIRYESEQNLSMFKKHVLQNKHMSAIRDKFISSLFKINPFEAIEIAVQFHQNSLVREFIELDKSLISHTNARGQTLLHLAAKFGNTDIYGYFLKCGLKADVLDGQGNTPSRLAYKSKQYDIYTLDKSPEDPLDEFQSPAVLYMLLLLVLHLPNFPGATLRIREKSHLRVLVELNNDFILITPDNTKDLEGYIESIIEDTEMFAEVSNQQDTDDILNLLQASYPDPERMFKETTDPFQASWDPSDDMLYSFDKRLKVFCVGFSEMEFNPQALNKITDKTSLKDTQYALLRLQHLCIDFLNKSIRMDGPFAQTVISQLHQEALELHNEEARFKYRKFQFKEPISQFPNLESFLQCEQRVPYIINDSIESAKISHYLGDRINYHVPGRMLMDAHLIGIVMEKFKNLQLVQVHYLDCNSKLTNNNDCENCTLISDQCQHISKVCKVIVSLKHPLAGPNLIIKDLDDETVIMIKMSSVAKQGNYIRLGDLEEISFQFCIQNGALEYIALSQPIYLGQTHHNYFLPWRNKIRKYTEEVPLADTFYESLDQLLSIKFSVVSNTKKLVISTCKECDETILSPTSLSMLACEASWRFKDKLIISTHLFSLLEITNCPSAIQLLTQWYQTEEDDALSFSWVQFYLEKYPERVIVMIDALDVDLQENHIDLLKTYFSEANFQSVLVFVDSDNNWDQIRAKIATVCRFELYNSNEWDNSNESRDKLSIPEPFPSHARVCEHFKQNPFAIVEHSGG